MAPFIYIDNNVVSAIVKDDTPIETDAIDRLVEAHDRGEIRLATSEVTLREIRNYGGGPMKKALERTFRLLEKIPLARWDELVGMHSYGDARTSITSPIIQNEPLYDELLKVGLRLVDAQHIYVSAKHGCAVFLTCDGGIIHRSTAIKRLCGIEVQRPSSFVAALDASLAYGVAYGVKSSTLP